jgi:LSD1 subclass zinc finger protein
MKQIECEGCGTSLTVASGASHIRHEALPPGAYQGPKLTPLKAIHVRCVDCNSDPGVDMRAWAHCDFDGKRQKLCPLWCYRWGKNPTRRGIVNAGSFAKTPAHVAVSVTEPSTGGKVATKAPETPERELERRLAARTRPLGAVRAYCLWCCADQAHEVRLCSCVKCALWPYRFGRTLKPTPWPEKQPVEVIQFDTVGAVTA